MRAESLWYGQLMGHRAPVVTDNGSIWPRGGAITDTSIAVASGTELPGSAGKVHQEALRLARATQWHTAPTFVALGPIAGYMPLFYVPSSMTMALARAAGFGPYNAAIAGRLVNLVIYVAIGTTALLITRRGTGLILATLLLPISLFLAASLSEDGLMIATSCLAAALATWAWEVPSLRTPRLLSAILIGFTAVTKPPYLGLAALLLPPLSGSPAHRVVAPSLLRRCSTIAIIAAVTIAWTAWGAIEATTPFWRLPREAGIHQPGPLWVGPRPANILAVDQSAQLQVLLSRPSLLLTLPLRTLADDMWRWREGIGVLGLLNVVLPMSFYMVWVAALGTACLADLIDPNATQARPRRVESILLLLVCIASVFAIYLSQYLAWTPVGAERIEGPQGRYLTPLMPLLAVALPRFAVPLGGVIRVAGWLALAIAGAIGLFVIPATIVAFYYTGP
jgi:uncharacterized membrane protein